MLVQAPRPRWFIVILAIVILGLIIHLRPDYYHEALARVPHLTSSATSAQAQKTDAYIDFAHSLVDTYRRSKPNTPPLQRLGDAPAIGWGDHHEKPEPRLNYVRINPREFNALLDAHDSFLSKSAELNLPYRNGTRGIVTTAGGQMISVFLISLRMIRRTGCEMPVELFLSSQDEYDKYLCETLLPTMNARCVVLADFFQGTIVLEKYQYKVFSILLSSFEEVLLLDADNFLVSDANRAFDSEPYTSSGLVSWPDFWISTAHAKFYEIQNTTVPPTNLRQSTESGQLLVNKRTHSSALLLASYYNFYGPGYYYPLLTQHAPGEGDKETFLAGAAGVGLPFYQVAAPVEVLGFYAEGKLNGIAMLQRDPVDEYAQTASSKTKTSPAPFAVHANFPKLNPVGLFGVDARVPIDQNTGDHRRIWGPKGQTIKTFGEDLERDLWTEIEYVTCELGDKLESWAAEPTSNWKTGTCEMVKQHIETVFGFGSDNWGRQD